MAASCYMVGGVMDCWREGGGKNVGAMVWRHHVLHEYDTQPRPFPHLSVMTPAGLVCIDCPETDPPHDYWTRTGEPPMVTVMPSINVNEGEWHGFVTDGVLTP